MRPPSERAGRIAPGRAKRSVGDIGSSLVIFHTGLARGRVQAWQGREIIPLHICQMGHRGGFVESRLSFDSDQGLKSFFDPKLQNDRRHFFGKTLAINPRNIALPALNPLLRWRFATRLPSPFPEGRPAGEMQTGALSQVDG